MESHPKRKTQNQLQPTLRGPSRKIAKVRKRNRSSGKRRTCSSRKQQINL